MAKERHRIVPASYLILRKNDMILLLRRENTGYEDGNYSMIAGHVDAGETFTQAIIREAKEEAGIDIRAEDLTIVHVMHRLSGTTADNERIDFFFETREWKGTVTNQEPHKCGDLSWFLINDLPQNIIPYIGHVLDAVQKGERYSEYGWNAPRAI